MRAKVASVVLVASALFGAVGMTAAPASSEVAWRDKDKHEKHYDHEKKDKEGEAPLCITYESSVVNVCVRVGDIL